MFLFKCGMAKHQKVLVLLMLLFTAAQSGVRLMVAPLWAHYDEPTHYEYVRFIVENFRLPHPGDADLDILSRIAANSDGPFGPCADKPAGAGLCFEPGLQFAEAPGYYVLQAVFQWLFAPTTVERQVWLARTVSALLTLVAAWLAHLTVRQMFPDDFLLAVAAPAMMATIFGYVDLMSAVNNDVSAVVAYSVVVFAGVAMIRQGITLGSVSLMALAAGLCVVAKSSAWIGLPLTVIGVGLAAWPRMLAWHRWMAVVVGIVAVALCFDLDSPADWYRYRQAAVLPARVESLAPVGQQVFRIEHSGESTPALWQPLPANVQESLRGQTVTVGAWVRAPGRTAQVPLPVIGVGNRFLEGKEAEATPDWTFHSYTVMIPNDGQGIAIYLPGSPDTTVEYDGVVLAGGWLPSDQQPQFADPDAARGTWNGAAFTNLLRNGSAESGWPMVRPALNRLFPWGGINYRLQSFYDWRRTLPVYWAPLRWQFVTFWAAYGAGSPGLPVIGIVFFAVVTGVSVLGLARAVVDALSGHRLDGSQWRALIYCGLAVAAALAMSVLRIDPVNAAGSIYYIPTARHFYVAIAPTGLLFMIGWQAWWPNRWRRYAVGLLLLAFYALGVWSLLAVQFPAFAG